MKKTILMMIAFLISGSIAFSAQQEKTVDLGRYGDIVSAFNPETGRFVSGFMSKSIDEDIQVMETYTQNLQTKLAVEKENKWASYVSPICNVTGYGLKGISLIGYTGAALGAFGLSAAYGTRGYLDILWLVYGRAIPYSIGVAPNISREEHNFYEDRYPGIRSGGRAGDAFIPGVFAPVVAIAAFACARTAQYLFAKVAKYQANLIKFEQEIAQNQEIICALQMMQ